MVAIATARDAVLALATCIPELSIAAVAEATVAADAELELDAAYEVAV